VLDALLVAPGKAPRLHERDTASVPGLDLDKKQAAVMLAKSAERLALLHQRLYAENERALLVVLQGMDTSGKDGAIKNVFRGLSPSATQVATFKAPSAAEQDHDYLWRVHAVCPERGRIGIFNRSHYEDVIAARVRGGLPMNRVKERLRHLKELERMLHDEGTTVVKCMLHISKDEQRERLQARIDDPEKRWKFRTADLDDRARWDAYQDAYEDALAATSTKQAPWYIVPADRKWLRDVVVAEIVVQALEALDPKVPPGEPGLDEVVIP
jgi:PPK2 family polyphosphate:nucleotide phosphotransferase